MEPWSDEPTPEDLTCRSITIVDAEGRPRIRLACDDGPPDVASIVLLDADGRLRLNVTLADDEMLGVWSAVTLHDHRGQVRAKAFAADNQADGDVKLAVYGAESTESTAKNENNHAENKVHARPGGRGAAGLPRPDQPDGGTPQV